MKIILGLILLIQASTLLAQESASLCQSQMQQKMERITSPVFNIDRYLYERIQENIYYSCRLGLDLEESWLCVDKGSHTGQPDEKVLHFNTKLNTWFETIESESSLPEMMTYSSGLDQGPYSRLLLGDQYEILIERSSEMRSENYLLSGIRIDDRIFYRRTFKNISCYKIESLFSH
jgi:hypothetical protein